MRILIVEDQAEKFGRVHTVLTQSGILKTDIVHAIALTQAYDYLCQDQFDLMLLDVNIPRRLGEIPVRGGGIELLRELARESELKRPNYIVGLTAFEDVVEEFGPAFQDQLWSLVQYSESSDRWVSQLLVKVAYIEAVKRSRNFSDGETHGCDLAIITALDTVEFSAVKQLPMSWQPLKLPHDETRYISGTFLKGSVTKSVIAAAAPRMGLAASAVLAAKMIHQFRPRLLAMVGICAGRVDKVKIGDIVIADPTWDWGSGKIVAEGGKAKFLPSPHQLDLDPDIAGLLREMARDSKVLSDISTNASGTKPATKLSAHVAPMVSGAAVVSHGPTVDGLLAQHRGIVGVDMEAYSVAAAAQSSGKPRPDFVVIKGVSDYADEHKADDYQEYAASVSALFLYNFAVEFL
ncbi:MULTISPECIES: response regulator [Agrobacterium]|uniref:Response regulator n=1 Tax=Agrobacterium tumefaciens TaxID=358 RepID=A0AAE6BHA0_AGRTU|nr:MULTISPECIES: response regulator [Agrobacterium]QCL76471.1 response regulator [Agrobacterium tumefaciens]QCL81990.1 response regulator [Agrobacterium tumefaciens]